MGTKIKLIKTTFSTEVGYVKSGTIIDVAADTAERWIKRGIAILFVEVSDLTKNTTAREVSDLTKSATAREVLDLTKNTTEKALEEQLTRDQLVEMALAKGIVVTKAMKTETIAKKLAGG